MLFIQSFILILFFGSSCYVIKDKIRKWSLKKWVYLSYGFVSVVGGALLFINEPDKHKMLLEFLLFQGLYLASLVDCYIKEVPNRLLLLLLGVWAIMLGIQVISAGNILVVSKVFVNFVICFAFLAVCYLLLRRGMGMGDVKLLFIIGIYTSFTEMIQILFFGALIAFVFSMAYSARKKMDRKREYPFVPFLCLGYVINLFLYK